MNIQHVISGGACPARFLGDVESRFPIYRYSSSASICDAVIDFGRRPVSSRFFPRHRFGNVGSFRRALARIFDTAPCDVPTALAIAAWLKRSRHIRAITFFSYSVMNFIGSPLLESTVVMQRCYLYAWNYSIRVFFILRTKIEPTRSRVFRSGVRISSISGSTCCRSNQHS